MAAPCTTKRPWAWKIRASTNSMVLRTVTQRRYPEAGPPSRASVPVTTAPKPHGWWNACTSPSSQWSP
jgi:hypothetical protein